MDLQGNNKIYYKREKGKIELAGSGSTVKRQIWFDLISSRLIVILIIVAVLVSPKTGIAAIFLKYLLKMFFP
jgi:hypothetical protein